MKLAVARSLLHESNDNLRLFPNGLSLELIAAFFRRDFTPIAAGFPRGGLFICVDLPPLAPMLQAVQRALMQVAASDGHCYDSFFDAIHHVVRLLLAGNQVVFDRDRFESAFAL
ncbi:hypothetical protein PR202_gb22545 [Eleusine coracana subsp. coracana]|uniref:Uncharacterized protein n=1 Tax=Eleusine coracana subsp. coracana TaxID=191504 RepID=A0AAV5FHZ6_ELECO|nr:hypothetical protein PR202_gb22545 [Eleusine coracana subsp. coracana]